MTTTTLNKEPAFIQAPANKPTDVTSGMQPAASGSIIGRSGAPDALLAGQDIAKAASSTYTKVTVRP